MVKWAGEADSRDKWRGIECGNENSVTTKCGNFLTS
jgi:hypothetical protein